MIIICAHSVLTECFSVRLSRTDICRFSFTTHCVCWPLRQISQSAQIFRFSLSYLIGYYKIATFGTKDDQSFRSRCRGISCCDPERNSRSVIIQVWRLITSWRRLCSSDIIAEEKVVLSHFDHNTKPVILFSSHSVRCEVYLGTFYRRCRFFFFFFLRVHSCTQGLFTESLTEAHSVSSWTLPGPAVKAKAWNKRGSKVCFFVTIKFWRAPERRRLQRRLHSLGPDCVFFL